MDTDLDTLATALYVTTDDLLAAHPERVPARPRIGFKPRISDAELLTLAVMQALLGFTSEDRFLRYARKNLLGMFPTLPGQSGYNKRLRKLADTMAWLGHDPGSEALVQKLCVRTSGTRCAVSAAPWRARPASRCRA